MIRSGGTIEISILRDVERVNAVEASLWLDGPTSRDGRVGGAIRDLFLDMNGIALMMPELTKEHQSLSAYERVAELLCPTLVIYGELDFPHIEECCQYLVETVPNAKLEMVSGTAHLPNLENPERINELLRGFLGDTAQ